MTPPPFEAHAAHSSDRPQIRGAQRRQLLAIARGCWSVSSVFVLLGLMACQRSEVRECAKGARCVAEPVRAAATSLNNAPLEGAPVPTAPATFASTAPDTASPSAGVEAGAAASATHTGPTPSQPGMHDAGPESSDAALGSVSTALSASHSDAPAASGSASADIAPSTTQSVSAAAPSASMCEALADAGTIALPSPGGTATPFTHSVILVSVDGLAPRFVDQLLAEEKLPTFAKLQREGAFTHNARTESRISVTLPNHTSMVTGRPAVAIPGTPADTEHNFLDNYDPGGCATLHRRNPALPYLRSVFDEAHDRGGYTSLYSGKSKFELFRRSYEPPFAAPDLVGVDNGQDKVDGFDIIVDTATLVPEFIVDFYTGVSFNPGGPNFGMLHIRDTDSNGHGYGWGGPEYLAALIEIDGWLGSMLDYIESTPILEDTVIVLTADHGGVGNGHYDPQQAETGTIPFYIWGRGIPASDLYQLTNGTRVDPGTTYPFDEVEPRPIRNGDAANVLLHLLGYAPLPGTRHQGMQLSFVADVTPDSGEN